MTARELVGLRVRVDSGGGRVHFGILQGLPGGDALIFDEGIGAQLFVGPVIEITDARLRCDRCGGACNRRFTHPDRPGEWCAECSRTFAQTHQAKPTCEECGAVGGAVRNPRPDAEDKRILCRSCHARVGSVFVVPGSFVRESLPRPGSVRVVCAAAHVPGTVQCEGAVKPRRPNGEHLCNAHAGAARTGERR